MFRRGDHCGSRGTLGSAGEPRHRAGLGGIEAMSVSPAWCDTDPERWRVRGRSERADLDGTYARPVTGRRRTFFPIECGFGYRTSRFKSDPGRFVVLSVTFQLRLGSMSQPIRYPELARVVGVEVEHRAPAAEVRQAVLALRSAKGMVLVQDDRLDTWSVGSFFTNPIVVQATALALPPVRPASASPMAWSRSVLPGSSSRLALAKGTGAVRPAVGKAHSGADQSRRSQHGGAAELGA